MFIDSFIASSQENLPIWQVQFWSQLVQYIFFKVTFNAYGYIIRTLFPTWKSGAGYGSTDLQLDISTEITKFN
jgi:hypothetical protein